MLYYANDSLNQLKIRWMMPFHWRLQSKLSCSFTDRWWYLCVHHRLKHLVCLNMNQTLDWWMSTISQLARNKQDKIQPNKTVFLSSKNIWISIPDKLLHKCIEQIVANNAFISIILHECRNVCVFVCIGIYFLSALQFQFCIVSASGPKTIDIL